MGVLFDRASAGGGSGDAWSDAVDANIVPDTNNLYTIRIVTGKQNAHLVPLALP